MARDHPEKINSRAERGLARNCTNRDLNQDWRGATSRRPTAVLSQKCRGTAPKRFSAKIGEGPRHKGRQQAPARIGGVLHSQRPQLRLARDDPTTASSRPQPGTAGHCKHRDLSQDPRGATSRKPTVPIQNYRGTAPNGTSANIGEDHTTKARSRPQLGLVGNCIHRDLNYDLRGTAQHREQQAPARLCGELHPQGPQPGLARTAIQKPATGSVWVYPGATLIRTSGKIGERPPLDSQQQSSARIGWELHQQGPQPGLATDHRVKINSRPEPRLVGNRARSDAAEDWRGTGPR